MMQLLPKWKVRVGLSDGSEHVIWISDHFLPNVLRKVADSEFGEWPLQVVSVEAGIAAERNSSVTTRATT